MVHCVDVCTGRYFQVQPGLPRPRTHETEVSPILKTGCVFRAPMRTARPFTRIYGPCTRRWKDALFTLDKTRHRASTSMYSLTFCVPVATHPQNGWNGTAHAEGASILSPARGVFAALRTSHVARMRSACDVGLTHYRWALSRILRLCCHSNASRAPIANLPPIMHN